MTLRSKLREALSRRLVPALKSRGFSGPATISGNALIHDYSRRGQNGIHHIAVQFDKRQRPFFLFSVRLEPPEGLDALIAQGGALRQGVVRARGKLGLVTWFRADRPWWERLVGKRGSREEEAVTEALSYLDDVDRWFIKPEAAREVRTFFIDYGALRKNA